MPTQPTDWTRDEVELIVADYFAMLEAELKREPYSKAEHNRRLQAATGRGRGSIEFKHQNISAVLVNFRQPFIAGYLPRQNYQGLLEQAVLEWLAGNPRFFAQLADGPVLDPEDRLPMAPDWRPSLLVEPPPAEPVGHVVGDEDGRPRFVKLTANEVRVSERQPKAYHLYRVFEFATKPRMYLLPGSLRTSCQLEPTQYRARVKPL
jgi:hypothetical protein